MDKQKKKPIKIQYMGDEGVGKSSLRETFFKEGESNTNYIIDPGMDIETLKVDFADETSYHIQLFDMVRSIRLNEPRSDRTERPFYSGLEGVFLVFDISRRSTLESLPMWIKRFQEYGDYEKLPIIIVGNKSDLRQTSNETIPLDECHSFVEQLNIEWNLNIDYIETSVKKAINLRIARDLLLDRIKKKFD